MSVEQLVGSLYIFMVTISFIGYCYLSMFKVDEVKTLTIKSLWLRTEKQQIVVVRKYNDFNGDSMAGITLVYFIAVFGGSFLIHTVFN